MWEASYFEIIAQIGPALVIALVVEKGATQSDMFFLGTARVASFLTTLVGEAIALAVVAGVWRGTAGVGQVCGGLMLLASSQMAVTLAGVAEQNGRGDIRIVNWPAAMIWAVASTCGLVLIGLGLF